MSYLLLSLTVIIACVCERGGQKILLIFYHYFFFLLLSLQLFKALALQPNSSIEIEKSKINRK